MKNLYLKMNSLGETTSTRFISKLSSLFTAALFLAATTKAQLGVSNFTYQTYPALSSKSYTGPGMGVGAQSEYFPASNNTFTYNFGLASGLSSSSLPVTGYVAGTSSFSILQNIITSVVMRRVNNPVVTGNRDILFFAGSRNPRVGTSGQTNSALTISLNSEYVSSMGPAFSQNNLLIGTDNIFSNQGNGNNNNNNIERVDVMISGGFLVTNASKYGFPILERGTYGGHDAFKIAVVTAIDASGNPTAYSNVVSATASSYNNTNAKNPIADGVYTYFLFKRDGTNDLQVDEHKTGQGIGGVAFRFSDFGIANGTRVYGYSLMANDFTGTSGTNVVDYTNTTYFPTNSGETVGGLDPLAVMGIAMETVILPVKMTSFSATAVNNKSELTWSTATEINNNGFDVERSADGVSWSKIGFVASKATDGNSNSQLSYSFQDVQPGVGINYYRVVQTDFSNKITSSEIRTVSFRLNRGTLSVFPNPVKGAIYVDGVQSGYKLQLMDNKGAVVSHTTSEGSIASIQSSSLAPGIYFVRVSDKETVLKTMKVVKM